MWTRNLLHIVIYFISFIGTRNLLVNLLVNYGNGIDHWNQPEK